VLIGDLYQSALHYGDTFDESSADGVRPRAHWEPLMESLHGLGVEELGRRWALAERRIRENGITYNIYGDPLGAHRPWRTDVVPLLLLEQEWKCIEAGIIQRAELLSRVLEDLYGEQTLLKGGHFPAALLFGNPGFLRPLVGVEVPRHSQLHMLAVDLARSPDGQWWVLADRTQAPSGSGYALENRTIISDLLPELFRASNVRRLAPFFRAQREALIAMATVENPRVVLHTPGPHNETYFEHSFLAKYLGFTLVVGADMTVRDRRVFLKTVSGLERVDVILRRVDDGFCDPLELRGDSLLGVPGLVDAIVAGNVTVANALGSGLIESAAIMPFLPGLAEHLLGEELKLPSVATWWCGQPQALDWVLNHLESVVVKPAFPLRGMEPVFGSELAEPKKTELVERMLKFPYEYVAQEQVALSTAPVWEDNRLKPRSVVLRTYVLHTPTGWVAMPGGLVRVSEVDGTVVSMQRGGHSKDAWVLSDAPVDTFSMLRPVTEPLELRRASLVVPSGVADNTFWLGRYVERAENMARILRSMVPRVRYAEDMDLASLASLHRTLGSPQSKLPKTRRGALTFEAMEKEVRSLLTDTERGDSLPSTLAEVGRVGGNVRERLSADMTLLIGQMRTCMKSDGRQALPQYSVMLTECLELLSAFSGMERENLIRGSGWLFMSLGRRLERAIYVTRQLRVITRPLAADDWRYLEYLLEVADSSVTYRTRYYTTVQPLAVMDVLMLDETNPRSLEFQLNHLVDLYRKLPRYDPQELQRMQDALDVLRGMELQGMVYPTADTSERRDAGLRRLDRFLGELEVLLPAWSNDLSSRYFSHARTLPIRMGE
jgi:uncharacterized circularly permuted ATP-grasp superfamily protein/uncharacterized alpha-E superfamily protein